MRKVEHLPMATDIAFSLGVLSLFGKRVPISLKVFLTTLAVVDDIGGILVIAIFYTNSIDMTFSHMGSRLHRYSCSWFFSWHTIKTLFAFFGIFVWFFFLNAGIHPTIAGVVVAFTIPAKPVSAPKNFVKIIRKKHFLLFSGR